MSAFKELREAVQAQFNRLCTLALDKKGVLVTKHVSSDSVWEKYLETIPTEHNKIFRERRYYDGNYDKQFIRRLGGLMFIHDDLSVSTLWDIELPQGNYFKSVCETLSEFVKFLPIENYFFTTERTVGALANRDNHDPSIIWHHFYAEVDRNFIKSDLNATLGKWKESKQMLQTSLNQLSLASAEIVLDLIASNSLYRGAEFEPIVKGFVTLKQQFDRSTQRDLWLWRKVYELGVDKCRIRNSVIGTLLEDLSNGVDLEVAVRSFESKVAPTNYKRTTALVTPQMVDNAKTKVRELGFEASIYRRLATEQDVPVVERLFTATKDVPTDVFGVLSDEVGRIAKGLRDVPEISWTDFAERVLPRAKQIEVLSTLSLKANEFVLTAPENATAPTMFKWNNGIAWSYLSDTADAIKERVKKAGGDVNGDVRISLAWHSPCDLDLSCTMGSKHIYFGNKCEFGGTLDIDMNALSVRDAENPVENIVFKDINNMPQGDYTIKVNNYCPRSPKHDHFKVQVDVLGEVKTYRYERFLQQDECKLVLTFSVVMRNGRKFIENMKFADDMVLESEQSNGEFLPVKLITRSPNYWGNNQVGNEHILFAIDGFKFNEPVRGFFNEYLSNDLMPHRKVFELLGNKQRVEPSDTNIGGYGFSITSQAEVVVRVVGTAKQVLKIKF